MALANHFCFGGSTLKRINVEGINTTSVDFLKRILRHAFIPFRADVVKHAIVSKSVLHSLGAQVRVCKCVCLPVCLSRVCVFVCGCAPVVCVRVCVRAYVRVDVHASLILSTEPAADELSLCMGFEVATSKIPQQTVIRSNSKHKLTSVVDMSSSPGMWLLLQRAVNIASPQ